MTNLCLMEELNERIPLLRRRLPEDLSGEDLRARMIKLLAEEFSIQHYLAEEAVDAWLTSSQS